MIYYFSGTGNSKWVAEQLAALTGDEAVNLAPMIVDKVCTRHIAIEKGARVGLVFPVYAWGAPKIVEEFARALAVDPAAYAYAVCTCGDDAGNAMQRLQKLYPWNAAWSVSMPNNYIPMYDVDAPALVHSKLEAARGRLPQIASAIERREHAFDVRHGAFAAVKTSIIHPLFLTFASATKPFFASDNCTGCGQCARNCPRRAIEMQDGKPHWVKEHCLQCMACIQRCPVAAIQYGDATKSRGRYHFEEDA